MEYFENNKAVRLKSHVDKYLVANDDQETTRQSRNGGSRQARWTVEIVDNSSSTFLIRLKSCHGKYLTASDEPFLLGMTGNKVLQTAPPEKAIKDDDLKIEWEPIRDGFQVKLKSYGGTYLRANGGPPPWRHSITHDNPHTSSTSQNWILWDVSAVEIPEDENLNDYFSMISTFSSVSDELSGLELGSPTSIHSGFNSPRFTPRKSPQVVKKIPAMELFKNAKAVRLRSVHNKYLTAEEDEESVTQDRNGSAKCAKWTVEYVENQENIIRLKSCYNKYLTASNQPFLLGMTGRKVLQTRPKRLDSSVEWEPIKQGNQVKLKTRYGQFLRANGGLPPWRNSVTHDIPHRTATQDWIFWDVHVVEILVQSSPVPKPPPPLPVVVSHSDSFASDSTSSPSTHSSKSAASFSRQESGDSLSSSPPKGGDGRMIFYQFADENGEIDEENEGYCTTFKGNEVEELRKKLEQEIGIQDIIVCTKSPLNGNLYPLRLQLPPNNSTMHLVIVDPSSKVGRNFMKPVGMGL